MNEGQKDILASFLSDLAKSLFIGIVLIQVVAISISLLQRLCYNLVIGFIASALLMLSLEVKKTQEEV